VWGVGCSGRATCNFLHTAPAGSNPAMQAAVAGGYAADGSGGGPSFKQQQQPPPGGAYNPYGAAPHAYMGQPMGPMGHMGMGMGPEVRIEHRFVCVVPRHPSGALQTHDGGSWCGCLYPTVRAVGHTSLQQHSPLRSSARLNPVVTRVRAAHPRSATRPFIHNGERGTVCRPGA
jgi:hypothetical protein